MYAFHHSTQKDFATPNLKLNNRSFHNTANTEKREVLPAEVIKGSTKGNGSNTSLMQFSCIFLSIFNNPILHNLRASINDVMIFQGEGVKTKRIIVGEWRGQNIVKLMTLLRDNKLRNISNYYRRSLVLLVGHGYLKGSKTSHFIRKSYFYKSLMTLEGRF